MSRSVLIASGVPLVEEVLRRLVPDGRDYSANLVVFPGKRPAHFLRKAISRHSGAHVPPRILSLDRFIDFMTDTGDAPRPIDRADAAAILFDLHIGLPERIGGDQFRSLDLFLPLGVRIFDELEELVLSCRPDAEITAAVSSVELRGLHSLGMLYARFYDQVISSGRTTRALKFRSLVTQFDQARFKAFTRVLFAGFFPLSEAERKLAAAMEESEMVLPVYQDGPGIRAVLDEVGIEPKQTGTPVDPPVLSYYSAPDSHGEIFGLAGVLQKQAKGDDAPDHRTAVLVPDPSVLPALVHHSLSALPGGYNISIGYPHVRTPVVSFLTGLMQLVDARYEGKFPATEYIRCFLHPYAKNILFEGSSHVTRVLFHAIEESCVRGDLPPFFDLQDLETGSALLRKASAMSGEEKAAPDRLGAHLRTLHEHLLVPLLDVSTVGECAERCIDILSFVASNSPPRRHLFYTLFLESVIDTLNGIRTSLLGSRSFDSPGPVFRIVRTCLCEEDVALPGTPLRGVQVLGLLETRNLQFDHVFVLNTNDELIPGGSGRYALIPNVVRRSLGIAGYRQKDLLSEYYFSLLLSGAKKVSLFYTDDGTRTPSRFIEQLIWKKEKEQGRVDRDEQIRDVRYHVRLEQSKPGPIPKQPGSGAILKEMTFSPSSLDTYLTCGRRFYYRYLLRLQEREDLTADLDRAELGRFVHDVLAEYYKPYVGKKLDISILDEERMSALVDTRFKEDFGSEELGNHYLMKLQVRDHLTRFLKEYESPRLSAGEVRLLAVEEEMTAERRGYRFRGRIDRIEQQADAVVISDFKTGGDRASLAVKPEKLVPGDRPSWPDAIGSFQLPLYLMMYADSTGSDPERINPRYLLLGKQELGPGIEVPLFGEDQPYSSVYPPAEEVLFAMLEELTDEKVPFGPTLDLEADCPYCPFTHLCGTDWVRRRGYS